MNKFILMMIVMLLISGAKGLNAQSSTENYKLMNLKSKAGNVEVIQQSSSLSNLSTAPKKKSPYLGALFSGLIPGTGEFYAESYIKAAVFFAIEAGLWTAYAVYDGKGDDQTEQFQQYANTYWSINKYARWLKDQQFTGYNEIINPDNQNLEELRLQVNSVERQNFSHQLPPFGEQQYYELIGKYQNFVVGWEDADPSISKNPSSSNYYGTYKTKMYTDYAADRQQANDYYDMASTSTTLVIVNHLLSAADAAWSVSMFNKDIRVKSSLRLQPKLGSDYKKVIVPMANVNVTF
jgi:hypothetical protein